uniref:Uncharacterized protein n=1 Tax=Sinocyclocheilus rhinocerous TaxID=307959 RepID=A0A673GJX8_9TELE
SSGAGVSEEGEDGGGERDKNMLPSIKLYIKSMWKMKNLDPSDLNNYRPITKLPVLS